MQRRNAYVGYPESIPANQRCLRTPLRPTGRLSCHIILLGSSVVNADLTWP